MILYQDKLCNYIKSLSIDKCPHSCIVLGKRGAGKTLISDFYLEHLRSYVNIVEKVNVTDKDVTTEFVANTINNTHPILYCINARDMSDRCQNSLLKLLEEPSKCVYLLIEADELNQLLDTVINRCQIWELNKYSVEELKTFSEEKFDVTFCETPGDVISLTTNKKGDIIVFVDKVVTNINKCSFGAMLKISDRFVDFAGDEGIYNFHIFLRVLLKYLSKGIIDNKDWYNAYALTNKLAKDCTQPHCNTQRLFEKYLIDLRVMI